MVLPILTMWCVDIATGGWPLSFTSVWSVGGAAETEGETEEQGVSHEHK